MIPTPPPAEWDINTCNTLYPVGHKYQLFQSQQYQDEAIMMHLNNDDSFKQKKKVTGRFKVRWNWYMQLHRLDSHFNRIFPTCITQVLAEVSYILSFVFPGLFMAVVSVAIDTT